MAFFSSQTITFDAAMRDLSNASERVRAAAAAALGDVLLPEERERAITALLGAVTDAQLSVRAAAASSLGELGGDRAVSALITCLEDKASEVRQVAAIALGTSRSPTAFAPLERLLREGSPELRFQAATSLAEIDPEGAREPLLRALAGEKDREVVGALALALGAVGGEAAREPLAALLSHPDAATRFDVAYALARLGDHRATPVLLPFLGEREQVWDAIEALELAGDGRALSALDELLARRFAPREHKLRAAAALLLLGAKGPARERARAELLGGLSAWKFHLRALAVELLARAGDQWALPALRAAGERRQGTRLAEEIAATIARIEGVPGEHAHREATP